MLTIGDKIRHFRTKKGYSQDDMARLLSIDIKTYSNLERNTHKNINIERLQKIGEVLEVNWLELLSFGEKTNNQIGNNNSFLSLQQEANAIYQNFTDKDLAHALEKSQQEVSFLKEKITLLEKEIENLKEINGFLREKTK
jgi:transcriptional regulator with XRE-family HTH domain